MSPAEGPLLEVAVLEAREVTVQFGGLRALGGVSLSVPPSTIVGLVGPNGAGKSTMFGVLSGLQRPVAGQVIMNGQDVTGATPQARARLGMARTFQQPELFLGLTVREHLVLAHRIRYRPARLWRDMLWPSSLSRAGREETESIERILAMLGLDIVASAPVAALPLGISRLVEIGRALATHPRVLLLDEPLSGLDTLAAENLIAVFRRVVTDSADPVSLLLVEHDVAAVMALSSLVYVLNFGQLIAHGSPDLVRNDPAVQSAYLGDAGDAGRKSKSREERSV